MTQSASEPTTQLFDPLSHLPNGALENPYPLLAGTRNGAPIVWSPKGNQWLVVRYEEANSILRNNSFGKRLDKWKHPKFFMRQAARIFRRGGSSSILLQDPPDHTRVRGLVNSAFTPRVVRGLEDHITEISNKLIGNMMNKTRFDLIEDFAFPLPVTVIAGLLGVPVEDQDRFKHWSRKITLGLAVSGNPLRLVHSFFAIEGLRKYLSKTIEGKREHPGADLISSLLAVQSADHQHLSQEELLANAILILIAGHETTTNLIANGVMALINHPEQKQMIMEDPNLFGLAVEEILRFDPAVQIVRRLANEAVDIGGAHIRPNDGITILIGACNRDPLVFRDPDVFDIKRENNNRHLTFGAGIHFCLGAELARTEARIALKQLFERMPNITMNEARVKYKGPFGLRGPEQLMIDSRH
ncbi:MAG: cytochrome P450 [Candidatus Melainabacteria bacterium]|nr:cytochrome P450 [Candidatus Melainabacteria bacterium]